MSDPKPTELTRPATPPLEPLRESPLEPARPAVPQRPAKGSLAALRIAWLVAIATDLVQFAFPLLFGPLEAVDIGLDLIAMGTLTRLLGWHWAFLPTFAFEMVPFVHLVPSWTFAVWRISRQRRGT